MKKKSAPPRLKRSLSDRFFIWFSWQLSFLPWLILSLWRLRFLRLVLFWIAIVVWAGPLLVGGQLFWSVFARVAQILLMALQGIVYFMAIMYFMSSTPVMRSLPGDKANKSFADYFGNSTLVQTVRQYVKLLEPGPERAMFRELGGSAPRGLLFSGSPGTGKTLMARCLAAESKGAFLGMSGSDFMNMFVGVGMLKVRKMFSDGRSLARQYGSCILFIDEIDAIGAARSGMGASGAGMLGGMMGGGMGILARLLTELSGLDQIPLRDQIQQRILKLAGVRPPDPGVLFVIFATNRPDVLDPALVRPGRIDRKIVFDIPDKGARRSIIKGFLGKVDHEASINVDDLAETTMGVTPAVLEVAILTEAPKLATFAGRKLVSQEDIENGIYDSVAGVPQPIEEMDELQKRQVAAHEAGHALIVYLVYKRMKLVRASIIRRSGSLGRVSFVPQKETWTHPTSDILKQIQCMIAGHVAAELVMGEPWTGASGDFMQVRHALAQFYGYYGLDTFPNGDPFRPDGPLRKKFDDLVKKQMLIVRRLLKKNEKKLLRLTKALLEQGELSGPQVVAVIEKK